MLKGIILIKLYLNNIVELQLLLKVLFQHRFTNVDQSKLGVDSSCQFHKSSVCLSHSLLSRFSH